MNGYPSADEYAFAVEPTRLNRYLEGVASPLLQKVASGRVVIPKGSRFAHTANGFFAYVYRIRTTESDFALRCPRANFPHDSVGRYRALSNFLDSEPDIGAHLVRAEYIEDALWVSVGSQGRRFPVQVMEWVQGRTLLADVAEKVRTNDSIGLRSLAVKWGELLVRLKTHGVVHGDLHPDNVIVAADGTMRLVDYDTLIVPGFTPDSTVPAPGGMVTYFHPCYASTSRPVTPYLDDFAALNIYLSLLALSRSPGLRKTEDYLLFGNADIESPQASDLFSVLRTHSDEKIKGLANAFYRECCAPAETNHFRIDQFFEVTPRPLTWAQQLDGRRNISSANRSPKLQTWTPAEHALPSSGGMAETTVQTRHEWKNAGRDVIPSSLEKQRPTVHPYEPE